MNKLMMMFVMTLALLTNAYAQYESVYIDAPKFKNQIFLSVKPDSQKIAA